MRRMIGCATAQKKQKIRAGIFHQLELKIITASVWDGPDDHGVLAMCASPLHTI